MSEGKEMIDYSKINLQKVYVGRHIELAVVKVEGELVTFRIVDQTHYGKEFCQKGKVFKAKNRISIVSLPKTIIGGITPQNGEYKCCICKFISIMEAVSEYNETDGKGYGNPWPQNGDKYFCIQSTGYVTSTDYDNHPIDNDRREFGNFFRTRDEAEAALERVKKAMNGE